MCFVLLCCPGRKFPRVLETLTRDFRVLQAVAAGSAFATGWTDVKREVVQNIRRSAHGFRETERNSS